MAEIDRKIAAYDKKIELNPKSAPNLLHRGNAYLEKNDYARAIFDFGAAITLDRKNAIAWNARCWARAKGNRDLDKALSDCNESLRLKPDEVNTLDSRGLVYLRLGRLDEAIADYNAVLIPDQGRWSMATSLYGRGLAEQKKHNAAAGAIDIAAAEASAPDIQQQFDRDGLPQIGEPALPPERLQDINAILMFPYFDTFVEAFYDLVDLDKVADLRSLIRGGIDGMLRTAAKPPNAVDHEPLCHADLLALQNRASVESDSLKCFLAMLDFAAKGYDIDQYNKLMHGALEGMIKAFDPGSAYNAPQASYNATGPAFGGIGAGIAAKDGQVTIANVIGDSPALRAGLEAGDVILEVDQAQMKGLNAEEAVKKIRGPVGSVVRLSVLRSGQETPIKVSVTRDIINGPANGRLLANHIGYIRISQFNGQTADAVKRVVAGLASSAGGGPKGYILDLRNDRGGLADSAVATCDDFLDRGEIASITSYKAGATQTFSARGTDVTGGKPLVVLINGGSASAAELIASALQFNKRAVLIGTKSAGVAGLQAIVPLGPGHGTVTLFTSEFKPSSGKPIQGYGIAPDIRVEQDVPETAKTSAQPGSMTAPDDETYVPQDPKNDKALQAAIGFLLSDGTKGAFPHKRDETK